MATYPRAKKPAIFAKKLGSYRKAKKPVVVQLTTDAWGPRRWDISAAGKGTATTDARDLGDGKCGSRPA